MPEIESLSQSVRDLSRAVDLWNFVMLWSLAFAAVAAIAVGISTRLVVVRTGQLAKSQELLSAAKDRQLKEDLGQKDADIAGLNRDAEALKHENLILAGRLLKLQKQSEARRLTGEQKNELAKLLRGIKGGVAIVSPVVDGEASDFADDFDSAIHNAHWETLRIKNRITDKFGVSVVTTEGTELSSIKLLDDALTVIGVPHSVSTVKDGDASTSPPFQHGYLYLVVEHKPLPAKDMKR